MAKSGAMISILQVYSDGAESKRSEYKVNFVKA